MTQTLEELRSLMDDLKSTNSTKEKKEALYNSASVNAVRILAGEDWDDSGVGPATARSAVESAYPEVDYEDSPTLSEALAEDSNIVRADSHDSKEMLSELCKDLDNLADLSGNEQKERLAEMLKEYTHPSIITFALLQDESVGMGSSSMKAAFVPDMSRDERKRLEALNPSTTQFIIKAKNDNLLEEPKVFEPFSPMLAKPESAGWPDNVVGQFKVDGYRLLIHVRNERNREPQIRAYSRRRKDVTHSLPELQEIDWPPGEFIFDCEVIAEDGTYKSTSSRIGKKPENITREVDMEFAMFDILHANGEDLTRRSLEDRYHMLSSVAQRQVRDPRVYRLEMSSEIQKVKQVAVEKDYEGVILKDLHSEYDLGKRSSSWVKEKHEREHVDVRVTDLIEGEGKQHGMLGKFIVESEEGEPLGGVGTGFTDELAHRIWRNQDEWIGGTIEVSAEAYDPSGDGGLRFPVFERDRRADGEPDSINKVEELLEAA